MVQVENSVYAAFCARLGLDSISQFQEEDVKQREGSKRERVPEGEADDRGKKVRLHRSDIIPITSSARWRGRPRRNDRDVSSSTQAKRPDIRNFFAKKDTS